jgi:hypothetical protein
LTVLRIDYILVENPTEHYRCAKALGRIPYLVINMAGSNYILDHLIFFQLGLVKIVVPALVILYVFHNKKLK